MILLFFRLSLPFRVEMNQKHFILSLVLIAGLGMVGCAPSVRSPVPVLNLGLRSDSTTGAMKVKEGDTLWSISRRYRLSLRDIIDLNGIKPPYALALGQRLKLPPPVDYSVRSMDTLNGIANMFGVEVSRLVQVNGLYKPYKIILGQKLRIPSSVVRRQQKAVSKKIIAKKSNSQKIVLLKSPRHISPPSLKEKRKVRKVTMLSTPTRKDFVWPVRGSVVSAYGAKKGGLYNDGINIAAPRGTPVSASSSGVVAYVGNDLKSYGNLVLIRHGGGIMTAYAHLASVRIKKGMTVRKGQTIGSVGATGAVSASQIHFEIRQGSGTCDPMQYLG
ncbi:MAG: M23 family metallopeptidase [Alphaproteobacteria bacterium]|nr:M23 family metallopeptidase [Alphaproteobacteria bacterium]MCK5556585.1 M23 family metallopeptidase [Alphaproteobacteria bacterium]